MELENLTKEDLIRVITNMHDTIQEWDNGWGIPKNESDILIKIGYACTTHCIKNSNWELPKI